MNKIQIQIHRTWVQSEKKKHKKTQNKKNTNNTKSLQFSEKKKWSDKQISKPAERD